MLDGDMYLSATLSADIAQTFSLRCRALCAPRSIPGHPIAAARALQDVYHLPGVKTCRNRSSSLTLYGHEIACAVWAWRKRFLATSGRFLTPQEDGTNLSAQRLSSFGWSKNPKRGLKIQTVARRPKPQSCASPPARTIPAARRRCRSAARPRRAACRARPSPLVPVGTLLYGERGY